MDVEGVVRSIAEALAAHALFIGGVAVEAYVAYRRTHDIDVIVQPADLHRLREVLEGQGFLYRESPHLAKHIFKTLEGGEVDAYTETVGETQVTNALFDRGRRLAYAGTNIFVAGVEDLLALKMAAGREMDLTDAAVLLWEMRDEVDHEVLETLVGRGRLQELGGAIGESLPSEYGWTARQRLKERLRGLSWTD